MIQLKKQPRPIILVLFFFSCLCDLACADSSLEQYSTFTDFTPIKSDLVEKRLRLGFNFFYTSLAYTAPLSGPGFGIDLQFALNDKWGLVGSFAQGLTTSMGPVYSGIDFRLLYALTGKLMTVRENYAIGSMNVLQREEYRSGGFRLSLQSNLQFFGSINSVVPFTGFGLGAGYEFSSTKKYNLVLGFRMDMIQSALVKLSPLRITVCMLY